MENVSKALLIAATVLVVIILITFGIRVFNSSSGSAEDAQQVGKEISLLTSDAADITAGYSVKRYLDTYVEVDDYYYKNYYTGIEIDENATYVISFDYIIEEKGDYDIGCGIGMGFDKPNIYNKDIKYEATYPNQEIGKKNTFRYELKPKDSENYKNNKNKHSKIYLSLRIARTYLKSTFKVKIENIKIKYKVE